MTWRDTFASLSTEDKIAAAILCAWPTTDSLPWRRWAVGWLTGEDQRDRAALPAYIEAPLYSSSCYASQSVVYRVSAVTLSGDSTEFAVDATESEHGIDVDPILDDIAAGDLQRHVDRVEQELACAP